MKEYYKESAKGRTELPGLPQAADKAEVKKPPLNLPPKQKIDVPKYALPVCAFASAALTAAALPNLIDVDGIVGAMKVALFAGATGFVTYIVNYHAIKDGAPYAAKGYWSAGIASVLSIAIVGGGTYAATYSGVTIGKVNTLQLQEHGQALARFVDAGNTEALKSAQTMPAIESAAIDIQQHVQCELSEGCLSKDRRAGRGPVARAIEPLGKRAADFTARMRKGENDRAARLAEANQLVSEYQTLATDTGLDRNEKWQRLGRLDAKIKQGVSAMMEATPLALAQAYASELTKAVSITGQPMASQNVSALLNRHGAAIQATLESLKTKRPVPPDFPDQAGVSATFKYISHFIPIAAIAAVIECVVPITLWIYTLLALLWGIHIGKSDDDDPSAPTAPATPIVPSSMNGARHD